MNFGEKLKQVRTDKGLTQPQFAQIAGLEQSYLSKLENDKSVPSAEMFSTILAGLGMDEATFLQDIDKSVLTTSLRHIPAVAQFTNNAVTVQVHHTKRWLYGAALAWVLGFAMVLAAHDGVFFSNKLYKYRSPGVVLPGEADIIFESHRQIQLLKMQANLITFPEMSKVLAEFEARRVQPVTVESPVNRGTVYIEKAENGRRRFDLIHTEPVQASENRVLQFLGVVIFFCGFVALFIEWRLRRLKNQIR